MKTFIIAAVTLDGFIARTSKEFPDWTSKEDKKSFMQLTENSALIFGGNTFRAIGRPLPRRKNIVYTKSNVAIDGVETTQESPTTLLAHLKSEGHATVAICGGSTIYSMFLNANLVDEVYLTIAPLLFGSGVTLLADAANTELELLEQTMLNTDTILLHYKVINR